MIHLENNSNIYLNLGVVGSRTFIDRDLIFAWLCRVNKDLGPFDKIITGDSQGADLIAESWAKDKNIETKICYADWTTLGTKASFLRNISIIDNSDFVIAFWDGDSKGTAHAIRVTRMENKPLLVISKNGSNYELLSTIRFLD
jgi:hypothetical protein